MRKLRVFGGEKRSIKSYFVGGLVACMISFLVGYHIKKPETVIIKGGKDYEPVGVYIMSLNGDSLEQDVVVSLIGGNARYFLQQEDGPHKKGSEASLDSLVMERIKKDYE